MQEAWVIAEERRGGAGEKEEVKKTEAEGEIRGTLERMSSPRSSSSRLREE